METLLLCVLAVLFLLVMIGETVPYMREYRGIRLTLGIIFAAANICYAFWAEAKVLSWDFPTRLTLSACFFPVVIALEGKLHRYKQPLTWTLAAVYLILLVLILM